MMTPRPTTNPDDRTPQAAPSSDTGANPVLPGAETVGPGSAAVPSYDFLAPPQAPDEIGRLGPYRVLALLGAGGMGMVFRAADPQLDRHVALKVVLPRFAANPHARQRFLREARAVAAVEHLHVVPIFHVGEDRGVPYLVMPLLKGCTLADALANEPRPAVPELVRIGREIAEGLAAAHALHLIHRDVKPGNVWLEGPERWVRLLDFGLARPDESAGIVAEPLTASGQFVGTPVYTSPEQARGEAVTAAGDLFSLGVVLYQMATGIVPFAAPTMMGVLTALATKHPDPPRSFAPALPPQLSDLIVQLLAKAPADRPPSAQAVAEALRRIDAGPTAAPVRRRRRGLLWAAAALLLVVGGGFLASQQIRVATPKGTLVIDADDPNVEVVVKKNGAVIQDKTRAREIVLEVGDYTIELTEAKDGLKLNTDRFAITRDGKETVHVRLEPPAPAKAAAPLSPDQFRKLVEWVLKQDRGGADVHFASGGEKHFDAGAVVPPGLLEARGNLGFWLPNPGALLPQVASWLTVTDGNVHIGLASASWDDQAFGRFVAQIRGIRNLYLHIESPSTVTDRGLKHLLAIPALKAIHLTGLKVSDPGVRNLQELKELVTVKLTMIPVSDVTVEALLAHGNCRELYLHFTAATPSCLGSVLKNTELSYLGLIGVPLSADDLCKISTLKKLFNLNVSGPRITNQSIEALDALPALWRLHLFECSGIDDGVFDHLGKLKTLEVLDFTHAKITDAGLAKVKDLPRLGRLGLGHVNVTADGVRQLRAALPKLSVGWDGDAKK